MPRKKRHQERPTQAEIAILSVLWQRGPSTVREVYEQLYPTRDTGYTTVLKLMQIMTRKGWLARDVSQRTHVYRAAQSQADTQRSLVSHLIERAFAGSASQLVERALSIASTSSKELEEIRHLLDEIERGRTR